MNVATSELLASSRLWRHLGSKIDEERRSAEYKLLSGQASDFAEYKYWSGFHTALILVRELAEDAATQAYASNKEI